MKTTKKTRKYDTYLKKGKEKKICIEMDQTYILIKTKKLFLIKHDKKKKNNQKETKWTHPCKQGCFVLLYGISNLFGSFNAELNFKQFSLV